ncbi:MAG: hypothetical protein ACREXJ_04365 [Gammaproteobacteria bacterium]
MLRVCGAVDPAAVPQDGGSAHRRALQPRTPPRGVDHLLCTQDSNGEWPAQDWTGVFFRTALLDYTLYRRYFPLWALALYRTRCGQRLHNELNKRLAPGP